VTVVESANAWCRTLKAKDSALTVCFAALYAVFCLFPMFQIIGLPSKFITLAAITAPMIGMLLGPYLGTLSTIVGGAIGFSLGHFSPPSFAAGVVAAFSAGMIHSGRRSLSVFTYFSLLFFFGFYPFVGPVWLYPQLMWFQIIGFLILVSPLQSIAVEKAWNSKSDVELAPAFFVTSLTSTLAGQIAGSLTFEILSWPIFVADINAWRVNWQLIAFLYPIERTIISLAATFIGVTLHKVLKSAKLTDTLTYVNR
jgi:hypothetical protein